MAKKSHSYSLKGDYTHENMILVEYDKKTETEEFYSINNILSEFNGKAISITIKEVAKVPTVANPEE